MKDKKDDKIKIEVSTYNWGPCVVKVKILDDFKKITDFFLYYAMWESYSQNGSDNLKW